MLKLRGIDVSKWQGEVNWKKVKAAGIKFAMIRLGHGDLGDGITLDPYFRDNINSAVDEGLEVGVYFYSYAKKVDDAKEEAKYVINILKPYKKDISYPVAYDLEDKSQASLGKTLLTDMIIAFCDLIGKEGYTAAFYTNLDWARNRLQMNRLEKYDFWLAQWAEKPTYDDPPNMWQYSSTGKVDGINGNVDLNISYKDYGYIDKLNKENTALKSRVDSLTKTIRSQVAFISNYQYAGLQIEKIIKETMDKNLHEAVKAGNEILKIINDLK